MLLGCVATLTIAGLLGQAFAPTLLAYWPLGLLALSPLPRHMVLVAPVTDPVSFVLVAGIRRFISGTLGYQLGLEYGEQGYAFVEARSARAGKLVRWVERAVRRFGAPLLIAFASPGLCAIAGTTKMPGRLFYPCALLGQLIYAGANYAVGEALERWTTPILVFLREHVMAATLLTASAVAIYEILRRRRRRASGVQAVPSLPEV